MVDALTEMLPSGWDAGFEVECLLGDGRLLRVGLDGCAGVPLEDAAAFRRFRFAKRQRSFAGWWWLATTGRHVGYESFTERDLNRTLRRVIRITESD